MKRFTSYIKSLTKGSRSLTLAASVLAVAGTFALLPAGQAFAATTHHILYNQNRSYGWCGTTTGNVITVNTSCSATDWGFTAEGLFDGYTQYEITYGGLCATVATSGGPHYSKNNVVMEPCQGVSNQLFVNPANPGAIRSVWAGYYYGCGPLGGPVVNDSDYGIPPNGGVSVDPCAGSPTAWYLPLA